MKAKVDTSSSCAATPSCAEGEAAALALRVGDELCTVAEGGALIDTVEHGLNVSVPEGVRVAEEKTLDERTLDGDSVADPHWDAESDTLCDLDTLCEDEAQTVGVAADEPLQELDAHTVTVNDALLHADVVSLLVTDADADTLGVELVSATAIDTTKASKRAMPPIVGLARTNQKATSVEEK